MAEFTRLISDCLSTYYQIEVIALALLPVGADMHASIYKVQASDQKTYFVKLRRGHHNDVNIAIMKLLHKAGMQRLIVPIKTIEGEQTQQMGDVTLIVYPFVQGQDGFSRSLTEDQWVALGKALRQVHEVEIPASLETRIRREDFSPKWRERVRSLYTHIGQTPVGDELALNLWKFIQENQPIIQRLVDRSEQLSQKIRTQPVKFILCHADIHAGNVLLGDKNALYIVDWDDPILAPKERDLMFIGGGVGNVWNKPDEEKLFYQGYGQTDIDWAILAYYRYERIVEDIAVYSEELLKPAEAEDRHVMYKHFMAMFAPRGVVDIAFETDNHTN